MKKPHLRLVSAAPLRASTDDAPPARWQGEDSIFFHKDQVHVGTRLLNFGRSDHNSMWEVVEIKTFHMAATGSGRVVTRKADVVTKLSDEVVIRRMGGNEVRQLSFVTLSYSAIWRIVQ